MRPWKSANPRRLSPDNHLNLGNRKPVSRLNSGKKLNPADHPGRVRQKPIKVWAVSA
jgi:hypothetical protein